MWATGGLVHLTDKCLTMYEVFMHFLWEAEVAYVFAYRVSVIDPWCGKTDNTLANALLTTTSICVSPPHCYNNSSVVSFSFVVLASCCATHSCTAVFG